MIADITAISCRMCGASTHVSKLRVPSIGFIRDQIGSFPNVDQLIRFVHCTECKPPDDELLEEHYPFPKVLVVVRAHHARKAATPKFTVPRRGIMRQLHSFFS